MWIPPLPAVCVDPALAQTPPQPHSHGIAPCTKSPTGPSPTLRPSLFLVFPHYLFLFLKPPLKEQHLGGWWVKAWRPGSPMGFTQIAVPTGLYLEAMPWLVSTQFCLLCGAGDPTQGIACAVRVVTVQRRSASALGDAGALAPPAGRAVGPSTL